MAQLRTDVMVELIKTYKQIEILAHNLAEDFDEIGS